MVVIRLLVEILQCVQRFVARLDFIKDEKVLSLADLAFAVKTEVADDSRRGKICAKERTQARILLEIEIVALPILPPSELLRMYVFPV